jgi:GAF domain
MRGSGRRLTNVSSCDGRCHVVSAVSEHHYPERAVETRTPTEDLDTLLRSCCRSIGLDGAGVSMLTAGGSREPFHATDEIAWEVERLQFTLGEGPCVDVASRGGPVLVADLSDEQDEVAKGWPVFRGEAARAGVRAIFAFPMRVGAINLGAVDVYRTVPGELSDGHLGNALSSIDRVALILLDHPTGYHDHDPGSVSDVLVHQAAGMVMVQTNSSIEQALARLRATAFAEASTVSQVAADVVHGRRRLSKEES